MRRLIILSIALFALCLPLHAQEDGLNLPTELYTLLRAGTIQRFGLGAAGVSDVTPPDSTSIDFGLSPDGVWLAYRTEAESLHVYHMVTAEDRLIDSQASVPPYRGRGQSIGWSPDGSAIAYTTASGIRTTFFDGGAFDLTTPPILSLAWSPDGRFLAAEAENDIWWVYRRDAAQMILHAALPTSYGAAWVSSTLLMIAPAEGGLFAMDTANANAQIPLGATDKIYQKPARRPDGSVVVFARESEDEAQTISPTAAYLHEVRSTVSGLDIVQISETSVELSGLRWAPGGRLLVTLQGGVVVLVDPISAQGFPLPLTDVAAYAWGAVRLPSIPNLPLTADVHFLGDDGTGAQQVWVLPADGAIAEPVTAHPDTITAYDLAPDGQTVAYVSGGGLWLQTPDSDAPALLFEGEAVNAPSFNADGTELVFEAGGDIILLPLADGGQPRSLLTGYSQPRFVSGLGGLLVQIADGDLGFYDLQTGEVRRLGRFVRAKPLADGRILAFGAATADQSNGLYLIDPAAPEPTLFYASPVGYILTDFTPLTTGPVRVILTRADGLPTPLRVFDVTQTGGPVSIPVLPYLEGARISRDGGTLAGYASGAGNLAVYSIPLAAESIPFIPTRIKEVRFSSFR